MQEEMVLIQFLMELQDTEVEVEKHSILTLEVLPLEVVVVVQEIQMQVDME